MITITFRPKDSGKDGGKTRCTGQNHDSAMKPLSAYSVQENHGRQVAQKLHYVGQQKVHLRTSPQVGHVQAQSVIGRGHHGPGEVAIV